MSKSEKPFRARVVDGVPLPLLTHAHELAIATVLLVLGAPALLGLLPNQGTPGDPLPPHMWEVWGVTMVVSTLLTFWGVFRSRPRKEWAGQLLAGYGLSFWSVVYGVASHGRGWPSVTVFGILALVSFWRAFKITSQPFIQHRLASAARDAHVRVSDEKTGRRRT